MANIFVTKLRRRLRRLSVHIEALFLRRIFRAHAIDFIFRDRLGVLTKRDLNDNIEYLLQTGDSCDAAPLMTALKTRFGRFETAFDVGANIGIVSAFLSKQADTVHAFEPEPRNIQRFEENMTLNACRNVKLHKLAISDREATMELFLLESYGHHSLGRVATSKIVGSIPVPVITIDKFCRENGISYIDFLKVDVEGFEKEVFEGAKEMLSGHKIGLVAFEVSQVPLASLNKNSGEIFEKLIRYGYSIQSLDGKRTFDLYDDIGPHADLLALPRSSK